mgnify:CR=1 FL=1
MNRRRSRRIFSPHTKYQIKWTCKKARFPYERKETALFAARVGTLFSVSRGEQSLFGRPAVAAGCLIFSHTSSYFLSHGAAFSRPLFPHGVSSLAGNICSLRSVLASHEITDTGRKHIPKLRYRRDHRIRDGHRISDGKKQNE